MQSSTVPENTKQLAINDDPPSSKHDYKYHKKILEEYIENKDRRISGFYAAITTIDKEWQLSRKQKKHLLFLSNKQKHNLGMLIAESGDDGACQAYLAYLKKLCEEGLDPEYIFDLLTVQNQQGQTLGHYVARYKHFMSLQAYTDLLFYLEQHGISSRQLFNLITLEDQRQWRFGHYIARYQSSASIKLFFELFENFLQKGIVLDEIKEYMAHLLKAGFSIGKLITRFQPSTAVQIYLEFLEKHLNTSSNKKAILASLLSTIAGANEAQLLLHIIAGQHDADCFLRYLRFLIKQYNLQDEHQIAEVLNCTNKNFKNAYTILAKKQSSQSLFHLIESSIFAGMQNKKSLAEQKERMLDYIMTLPHTEKIKVLEQALTPSHPLYQFFAIKRGICKPHVKAGSFARIQKELDLLYLISTPSISSLTFTLPSETTFKWSAPPVSIYNACATQSGVVATETPAISGLYPAIAPLANHESYAFPSDKQKVDSSTAPAFFSPHWPTPILQPFYSDPRQEKFITTAAFDCLATPVRASNITDLSKNRAETNLLSLDLSQPVDETTPLLPVKGVPSSVSVSPFAIYTPTTVKITPEKKPKEPQIVAEVEQVREKHSQEKRRKQLVAG